MADWDFDPMQFEEDQRQTALNKAIEKLLDAEIEILKEMKDHIQNNERHNFDMKMSYHLNRVSQLAVLGQMQDNPDFTDEDVEKIIQEVEQHTEQIDYNTLFAMDGDEPQKRGLDVLDYIKKEDDDPFEDF